MTDRATLAARSEDRTMTDADRDAVERLAKWADGEAMAAYGDNLVDDPEDHEGAQVANLLRALLAAKEAAEAELHLMKTAGIIEMAVRNPSVSEYMEHWESRAETAEAEAAALREKLEAAREGLETAQAQAQGTPHQPFCAMVISTCADTLATIDQPKEGDEDD